LQQIPRRRYEAVVLRRLRTKRLFRRHSFDPSLLIHSSREGCIGDSESVLASFPSTDSSLDGPILSEEDDTNKIRNQVLIALNDTDGISSRMIENISNNRHNVVSMWKRASRIRYSPEEVSEVESRRIEQSSWRIWFKQRHTWKLKELQRLMSLEEKEMIDRTASVLHSVSSFTMMAKNPAAYFGDYIQGLGTEMNYNPDVLGYESGNG
jgi:hypothetical protein